MSSEQNPVDNTTAVPFPFAPTLRQLRVNETTFAFRESGQGDPMILVHGNISDIRTWNSVESSLARHFRVIVYSRRYAWPNTPIGEDEDDPWDVHANDLEALITNLDLSPVHIVGNSAGAYIALLLARRRPELFRTLILEEPPVVPIFLPSNPPTLIQILSFSLETSVGFPPNRQVRCDDHTSNNYSVQASRGRDSVGDVRKRCDRRRILRQD